MKILKSISLILLIKLLISCEKETPLISNDQKAVGNSTKTIIDNTDPFLDPNFKPTEPPGQAAVVAIQSEIIRRFEGIPSRSRRSEEVFLSYWNEGNGDALITRVGAEEEGVRDGVYLPSLAVELLDSQMNVDQMMESEKLSFATSLSDHEIALRRILLALSASSNEFVSLASIIESQPRDLPPTKSDLYNLLAFLIAFEEYKGSAPRADPLEAWKNLAKDPNPIYRILAIRGIGKSQHLEFETPITSGMLPSPEFLSAKLEFLKPFLEEREKRLVVEAVRQIGLLGVEAGENLLSQALIDERIKSDSMLERNFREAIAESEAIRKLRSPNSSR